MTDSDHNTRGGNSAPSAAGLGPLKLATESDCQQALEEIKARGESPEKILRAFDLMDQKLRAKHLTPMAGSAVEDADALSAWPIGDALYFEESVAAGAPTIGQGSAGRRATLSDLLQSIDPRGKLLVRISGPSMSDASIQHGDTVLVDPQAEIRDGDLALVNFAGGEQAIKRARVAAGGAITLESDEPDREPIKMAEPTNPRICGKVVWRCGPLR